MTAAQRDPNGAAGSAITNLHERWDQARAGTSGDGFFATLRQEAQALAVREPLLASLAHIMLLDHGRFQDALSFRIAQKLTSADLSALLLRDLAAEAMSAKPGIAKAARADLVAVLERDPACRNLLEPLLFFKGYQAIQSWRISHYYWEAGRKDLAKVLQMRISEVFAVDIHPAATIGKGVFLDHATGFVAGETASIGDDCSILHGVTLGGTGKEGGDRHPKLGNGVLIGAGAKVLGNIKIGDCSRVAAGSVVLEEVPPCKTVAGVPARIVGDGGCDEPARSMDHRIIALKAEIDRDED